MRPEKRWQLVIAAAACLWIAAVVLAPGIVFPIGHFVCHQRPERSFFYRGQQLAVCARCSGIYLGAAIAAPIGVFAALPLPSRRARWLLMLAALPTLVTWTLEFSGLMPFSNLARALSGLPLGVSAAWLVLGTLSRGQSEIGDRASHSRRSA